MRRLPFLLLLALAACDPLADQKDDLRAARERWQDADIDAYRFVLDYSCFCMNYGDFEIVVENDSIVSAVHIPEDEPEDDPVEIPAMTIDEMLDRIEDALDREPVEARLRFHALGYPISAWFDFEENMADEEWGFGVDTFSVTEIDE